jgi:hypothetical protein
MKQSQPPPPGPLATIDQWYNYIEMPPEGPTNRRRPASIHPKGTRPLHSLRSSLDDDRHPAKSTISPCDPATLSIAQRNGHLTFTNAAVSLALPMANISQLKQQLQSFEDLLHKDPESFITALPTLPVAVGLRVIDSHFRDTPLTGYCTAHVLHEITNGTPSGPILHKDGRQSLVTTMEFLQRNAREAHLDQAHGALSTYLEQLQNTETDTLAFAHWMPADLLTGICNTIETSTTIWTEDILSPFPAGWMQPVALQHGNRQVHSRVSTPLNQVATTYSTAVYNVGNARSHHFMIRYPHKEIGQQFKCLILSMAQYLLTMPALEPDPHDATTVSNGIK